MGFGSVGSSRGSGSASGSGGGGGSLMIGSTSSTSSSGLFVVLMASLVLVLLVRVLVVLHGWRSRWRSRWRMRILVLPLGDVSREGGVLPAVRFAEHLGLRLHQLVEGPGEVLLLLLDPTMDHLGHVGVAVDALLERHRGVGFWVQHTS